MSYYLSDGKLREVLRVTASDGCEKRALTKAVCEDCGTPIIDNCVKCGAPQCCPKCCAGIFANPKRSDSLLERLPMSYAYVIQLVAKTSIRKCLCYGHLCGECGDAKVVLDAIKHMHVLSENGDMCASCGLDLRDDIHRRLS